MITYSRNIQALYRFLAVILFSILSGCQDTQQRPTKESLNKIPTSVHFNGTSYELLRYGEPYFIKGAGGVSHFEELKAAGGTSIRIWDENDAERILDEAQKLGLTVMFGLWVERQVEGFDYDDQNLVEKQRDRIRKTIFKYRNHPALLLWCIGNEVIWGADNIKAYDEINYVAKLAHELDPNHPVTTTIMSPTKRAIRLITSRCPDIDILSINDYELMYDLSDFFNKDMWPKPYIISEYGAQAWWDAPVAPWGDPDEPTSEEKVRYTRRYYKIRLGSRPPNCFGGYLFYWGNKIEESHTWFSVFSEQGDQTPLVGLMQELWSGRKPLNQAPVVQSIRIDGQTKPHQSFSAAPGWHRAEVLASDPDGDSLTYRWAVKPRFKQVPYPVVTPVADVPGVLTGSASANVQFRLPPKPGAYQLFVNVYDSHKHVGTANFSFQVKAPQPDN